jgi:hypothetical protein
MHNATESVRDGMPESAAGPEALRQDQLSLGAAVTVFLDTESAGEFLRNALQVLRAAAHTDRQLTDDQRRRGLDQRVLWYDGAGINVDGRYLEGQPLADLDRLLSDAVALIARERVEQQQLRRNLGLAQAQVRRLEATIGAPQPRAITRTITSMRDDGSTEALIVVMSDGSLRRYWPESHPSNRWEELEPIPGTRKALLDGGPA